MSTSIVTRYPKVGGYSVLDPRSLAEDLQGLDVPVDFWRRANSIHCPIGMEPGRAWFVVDRSTMAALDGTSLHDITWIHENGPTAFHGYILVSAHTVGVDGDSQAAYLIELQDKRRLLKLSALETNYNLHNPAPQETGGTDEYYSDTLDSGSLWTWQTAIEDAWSELPTIAGTCPTLPYTPTSQPEDLRYLGYSAWTAVNEMLRTIGCTVAYDPIGDEFTFVRFGDSQEGLSAAFVSLTNRLMYADEQLADHALADAPKTVRVYFPRRDKYQGVEDDTLATGNWEIQPYYWEDTATEITGAQDGTILRVWDAMPALYTDDALVNSSDLVTRAGEITDTVKKTIDQSFDRLRKHYSGIVTTIQPGSEVRNLVWRDYGAGGCVTEVHKLPVGDLLVGVDWATLGSSENFQRPDLARRSHPVWPHVCQIAQIWDSGSSLGDMVTPDATTGLFPGQVRSYRNGTLRTLDPCWVRIADLTSANGLDGDHVARNGDCFIGRLFGLEVVSADERPVYLVRSGESGGGTRGACLDEDHPGRGVVFDIHLGTWSSSLNKWIYDTGTISKAIDWRYGVPYPLVGSTGLFASRASDTHGTIWECVSLDCETPGVCGS